MNHLYQSQNTFCMYDPQGKVDCKKIPNFQQCDFVHVPICTSINSKCSDPKECKSINEKMFIRFQDEKNTWR